MKILLNYLSLYKLTESRD